MSIGKVTNIHRGNTQSRKHTVTITAKPKLKQSPALLPYLTPNASRMIIGYAKDKKIKSV